MAKQKTEPVPVPAEANGEQTAPATAIQERQPTLQRTMPDLSGAMEKLLIKGDLGALSAAERTRYYVAVCESLGLNPLTQPFDYVNLGNKLRLYAKRECAEQLRQIHSVSVEMVSQSMADDCLVVHVRAMMPTAVGMRRDEDLGVVNMAGLKGENRANAVMKAITKAKRRVTLSICGLGFLDETEVSPGNVVQFNATQSTVEAPPPPEPPPAPPAKLTSEQFDEIEQIVAQLGKSADDVNALLAKMFGAGEWSVSALDERQAVRVINRLRKALAEKEKADAQPAEAAPS